MPAIIFCQCGSDKVDVRYWMDKQTARIRCAECGNESQLTGFTLGRFGYGSASIAEAKADKAVCRVAGS